MESIIVRISFFILIGLPTVFGGKNELPMIAIDELIPLQANVGFLEVERKNKKILNSNRREEKEYFEKQVVPVVRGPDGKLYIVDHHHFTRAAYDAGRTHVYYKVIQDYNFPEPLTMPQFAKQLINDKRVYLKDVGRPIKFGQLPKHIREVTDDIYRSLAGFSREEDAFKKINVPFVEFSWADFFRALIPEWIVRNHFNIALDLAVKLGHSEQSGSLAGTKFKTGKACRKFYSK